MSENPLCEDVIGHIIQFLPTEDLFLMGFVDKTFRRISSHPWFWKSRRTGPTRAIYLANLRVAYERKKNHRMKKELEAVHCWYFCCVRIQKWFIAWSPSLLLCGLALLSIFAFLVHFYSSRLMTSLYLSIGALSLIVVIFSTLLITFFTLPFSRYLSRILICLCHLCRYGRPHRSYILLRERLPLLSKYEEESQEDHSHPIPAWIPESPLRSQNDALSPISDDEEISMLDYTIIQTGNFPQFSKQHEVFLGGCICMLATIYIPFLGLFLRHVAWNAPHSALWIPFLAICPILSFSCTVYLVFVGTHSCKGGGGALETFCAVLATLFCAVPAVLPVLQYVLLAIPDATWQNFISNEGTQCAVRGAPLLLCLLVAVMVVCMWTITCAAFGVGWASVAFCGRTVHCAMRYAEQNFVWCVGPGGCASVLCLIGFLVLYVLVPLGTGAGGGGVSKYSFGPLAAFFCVCCMLTLCRGRGRRGKKSRTTILIQQEAAEGP